MLLWFPGIIEAKISIMIRSLYFFLVLLLTGLSPSHAQTDSFSLLPDHKLQPASLIDIAHRYRYAMISELETGKLHVYERLDDGQFLLIETFESSIGKQGFGKTLEGDNKTPVGVYRITSHLTRQQLDDFYGNAAYPVNYPNAWDRRHQRTGFGIWLHAEPVGLTEKTRPLLDTDGCIVLSNNDIDKVQKYIDIGYTYIVMTPKIKMVPVKQVQELRKKLHKRLDEWQASWETLQDQPYLGFYSKNFASEDKNWEQWVTYKKRIHKNKKFIKIGISDIGMYAYPGEENVIWVEYYQTYASSNFKSKGWKRQMWKLEADNVWRIIYEGGG